MDVEISLQDFRDQRPNTGLSTLIKRSNTFLNIIYNERLVFKYAYLLSASIGAGVAA